MSEVKPMMAKLVARAASAFQHERTGHTPNAVAVVLSGDTLVITLYGALTPAERAMARDKVGAAKVQEFHRQLFASSTDGLWQEIKRITGVEVREAAAEVEAVTGSVVHAFTSGTMVQVFLLAESVSSSAWSGNVPEDPDTEHTPDGADPVRSIEVYPK